MQWFWPPILGLICVLWSVGIWLWMASCFRSRVLRNRGDSGGGCRVPLCAATAGSTRVRTLSLPLWEMQGMWVQVLWRAGGLRANGPEGVWLPGTWQGVTRVLTQRQSCLHCCSIQCLGILVTLCEHRMTMIFCWTMQEKSEDLSGKTQASMVRRLILYFCNVNEFDPV